MALSQAQLAAFEAFWAAYPRRPENPKAEARKAFAQILATGVEPQQLVAAAGCYAAFCAKSGKAPEFVPYASTWLRKRRFEDFADVPAPAGPAAQPAPEHPLAWLLEDIDEAAWRSWIEPLQLVEIYSAPTGMFARTQLALDHVRRQYGPLIVQRYGDVVWGLQSKDRP